MEKTPDQMLKNLMKDISEKLANADIRALSTVEKGTLSHDLYNLKQLLLKLDSNHLVFLG